MKTHIEGTNGRTFCGHVINPKTVLLAKGVPEFMSDCTSCLNRVSNDCTLMVQFMNLLQTVCKDSSISCNVNKLHNQQLKQEEIRKSQQKEYYGQS